MNIRLLMNELLDKSFDIELSERESKILSKLIKRDRRWLIKDRKIIENSHIRVMYL